MELERYVARIEREQAELSRVNTKQREELKQKDAMIEELKAQVKAAKRQTTSDGVARSQQRGYDSQRDDHHNFQSATLYS